MTEHGSHVREVIQEIVGGDAHGVVVRDSSTILFQSPAGFHDRRMGHWNPRRRQGRWCQGAPPRSVVALPAGAS